jgi:DNA-binding NarL/FixJ family response regulator
MTTPPDERLRRVLIVSSHPLLREGLRSLLHELQPGKWTVRLAASTSEAVEAAATFTPELVIVDYDDEVVTRDEFLTRFVAGEGPTRVVLVSLKETGQVVVYDRRNLTLSQTGDVQSLISYLE